MKTAVYYSYSLCNGDNSFSRFTIGPRAVLMYEPGGESIKQQFLTMLKSLRVFQMNFYNKAILLLILNVVDAFLTLYWVRHGYATEGNHLMATLLDLGNLPFLMVKVAIGVVAAFCFWNWKEFKLARFGLSITLVMYVGVMGVHLLTGLAAAGLISGPVVDKFSNWSQTVHILIL